MTVEVTLKTADDLILYGERIGRLLSGGETIELIGDVGTGKTTLTKGLARGLEIDDEIQSPTFTISRTYSARDGMSLVHYDFYRLHDAGIMQIELAEAMNDAKNIVVIEWSGVVDGVLPQDRLQIIINTNADDSRKLTLKSSGERSQKILEELR